MQSYSLNRPSTWILPFLLAAFLLCTSPWLSSVFNATTRWAFLALAMLLAFSHRQMWLLLKGRLAFASACLIFWPMLTIVWSASPSLSLVKSLGFLIVACSMFACGAMWARMRPTQQAMDALFLFFIVFAVLIVVAGIPAHVASGYDDIYEGAGNPNFTGIATAICMPLVLWHLFKQPAVNRWFWWAALGFLAYMLLAVLSRGAIMLSGLTALGCMVGMGVRRRTIWIFSGLLLLMVPLMLSPKLASGLEAYIYQSIIMKGVLSNSNVEDSVFASRDVGFHEQMRAAKAGGMLGGGYGEQIEVGHYIYINDIPIKIPPGTYKREKGNAVLAIAEEQGWIGVLITITWLWVFFSCLIRQYRRVPDNNARLQMGMLIAFLIGMIILSLVEAWWVSPGSMEALVFWSMAGLAYGLGSRYEYESINA